MTGTAHISDIDDDNTRSSSRREPFSQRFDLTISPRNFWNTYNADFDSYWHASPGTMENCVGGGTLGFAGDVDDNCDDYINDGYPRAGRGSGPWRGLWYLMRHNTSVDVAYQIDKRYRSDGTPKSLNGRLATLCGNRYWNMTTANSQSCSGSNEFSRAFQLLRYHESRHVVLASQQWDSEDLFERLDAMTGNFNGTALVQDSRLAISNSSVAITNHANFHSWARQENLTYWSVTTGGTWSKVSRRHTY